MQRHCLKQIKLSVWWKETFHVRKKSLQIQGYVCVVGGCWMRCTDAQATLKKKKKRLTVCQYCCLFSFKATESIASNIFLFHCWVLRTLFCVACVFFFKLVLTYLSVTSTFRWPEYFTVWTAINANQSQDPLVLRPMSQFSLLSLKQHWSRLLPSRSAAVMHSPVSAQEGPLCIRHVTNKVSEREDECSLKINHIAQWWIFKTATASA